MDILGAQTQGMIGYLLGQALQNALLGNQVATLVTQTLVSAADPAFADPTKFVGPRLHTRTGCQPRRGTGLDGASGRSLLAAGRAFTAAAADRGAQVIRALVESGTLVVCAGGGGVPVVRDEHNGWLRGVEAVVDKDQTAALLAEVLDADALLLLTDVPAVIADYGTPGAAPIRHTTPAALRSRPAR